MIFENKLAHLKRIISAYKSVVVAFSGGQDSAFLLKICAMVLPADKILAVTAVSTTYPESELAKAKIIAQDIGVKIKIIKTAELNNKKFSDNSVKRCYYCKQELFSRLNLIAQQEKLDFVLDASNVSDNLDYRPGNIAKREQKVKSPLINAGFSKDEICKLSKKLGLSTWNKPSLACLASRIPYGVKITADLLKRINRAETYLNSLGFKRVRLRHHQALCRIEVDKNDLCRLLNKREQIIKELKSLGYQYITLDLEGYRTGSLNEVIKR